MLSLPGPTEWWISGANSMRSTKADPRGSRVRPAMAGRRVVAEGGWIRDPVANRAYRRMDFFGPGAVNTGVCGQT
jgi:hypothetical protein